MSFKVVNEGSTTYVVNESFLEELPLKRFQRYISLSYARDAELSITGRGTVRYIILPSTRKVVVRKGFRGGVVARFNEDIYFQKPSAPLETIRQVRELRVLNHLREAGISVPPPVAALITFLPFRIGYRAYLATEDVGGHNLLFLGSSVVVSEMGEEPFRKYCRLAGMEVRKMLDAGVFHTDLHPGNVLYTTTDKIYLIDFDNAFSFEDTFSRQEAEERLIARWSRACQKHFLEEYAIEPFAEGLTASA